ncbi:MAG: alpha-(1-_3)-arabinofuranosyltransferase family protein, partial [Actinomycetota bacterium]
SGLLTPWALLPWMLLCVVRARKGNTIRWSLMLGVLVATAGSVNVTALAMVFVGVITWMVIDVATGIVRLRQHVMLLAGSMASSLACGAWWITALVVQGRYGLPILRYTETYETVAKASTPQEILRGLGYWFFYGNDHSGAWVDGSTRLIGTTPLLALGMLVATMGLVSVGLARHRHSPHSVALLVVGLAIAVGSNPQGASSLYGRLFESVVNNESGFALRSSPRATPVVLIALAVSLGFAWDRYAPLIKRIHVRLATPATLGLLALLLVAQNYPGMTGRLLTSSISRDEVIPAYWNDSARAIDSAPHSDSTLSRTYELPGVDFATYTWGGTIDPVTPGLIDSQHLARELVPYGSDATADLLNAFESRLQEGRFEPSTLKDVAALFGANTVTFRGDVRYDTYRTPNPGRLWREISMARLDVGYESPSIRTEDATTIADATLLAHPRATSFPATAILHTDPQPLVSVSRVADHTRLVGSGDGVIDAVTALGRNSLGSFIYDSTASLSRAPLGTPARVIVTDSNRRQSRRWYSVGSNLGRTERVDEDRITDPSDNRLMPFVDDHAVVAEPSTQSVSLLVGDLATVSASDHGHPIVSTPEDRPENAFDGDPDTSWRTGIIGRSIGQYIDATFRTPVSAARVTLTWPRVGNTERRITKGRIVLYAEKSSVQRTVPFSVSNSEKPTTVVFPQTTFSHLRVIIDDDTFGVRTVYDGLPGTGIAEVSVPGVHNEEFVLVPTPSQDAAEVSDTSYVFSRWRLDEATPNRNDPEARLLRAFDRSSEMDVKVTGVVRLNGNVDDATLVSATGNHPITAVSNRRLAGSPYTSAMNTLDGDTNSAWVSPIDEAVGSRIRFEGLAASRSTTISFLDDPWHSRPEQIELAFDDNTTTIIDVPATGDSVTVRRPTSSSAITALTVTKVTPRYYPDYFT